jgi:hypothetical protein
MGRNTPLPEDWGKISAINRPGIYRFLSRRRAWGKVLAIKEDSGLAKERRKKHLEILKNKLHGDYSELIETKEILEKRVKGQNFEMIGLRRETSEARLRAERAEQKVKEGVDYYLEFAGLMKQRLALATTNHLIGLLGMDEDHPEAKVIDQINMGLVRNYKDLQAQAELLYKEVVRRGEVIFKQEVGRVFETEKGVSKSPIMVFASGVHHYATRKFEKYLKGSGLSPYGLIKAIKADTEAIDLVKKGKEVRREYEDFDLVLKAYNSRTKGEGVKAIAAYMIPKTFLERYGNKMARLFEKRSQKAVDTLMSTLENIGGNIPDIDFNEGQENPGYQ